ncbi:MAG: ATP-dependent DNA helicase [Gammaproteobacteria bacterium]|nr:ATP-dependent DNA helicase [Gammaproteobacteria bacterium]
MTDVLNRIFSHEGLLSRHLPGFSPRDAQFQMAQKIEQIIEKKGVLLCEAGTGTGKTYAYLVPSILSLKQTIISTGTKNLQDQLYHKDLPVIAAILEPINQRDLNYSILKGRSNYVCVYRFEKALDEAWYDEQTQADLQVIKQTLKQTKFADISEFSTLKEQSLVWPIVTSTSDNCLGGACPNHADCYVLKAREQAFEADVIIVNHHLLMADLKLKTDTLGELLPSAQTYIIDEAHQLPDIASRFLSREISSKQINDLLKESRRFVSKSSASVDRFYALNDDIKRMLNDLIMVINRYKQRGSWSEISLSIKPLCDEIVYALRKLKAFLEPLAMSNAELERCFKRSEQILIGFDELTGITPEGMIHWFECKSNYFTIQLTPLSIGDEFKQHLDSTLANWVFTSATLAVNCHGATQSLEPFNSHDSANDYDFEQEDKKHEKSLFAHFANQLALHDCDVIKLESPFNYSQQAILYAPKNLPLPNDEYYISSLIREILPVIEWLEGKTFFLFTSHRAMQEAREILKNMDFQLLVQGDAPKQQLVEQFKVSNKAILLGTSSFWEGVDVKGQALSCVVIDKLPFASPYEPVLQTRIRFMKQQGMDAFSQYQLPQAGMALKQGAGRLIRDINDYGILVIADPRFFTKAYGYYLRKTLPAIPIETELQNLQKKFSAMMLGPSS